MTSNPNADASHRQDDEDIHRWFESLTPRDEVTPSDQFRANLWDRIAEAPQRGRRPLVPAWRTVWAASLAAVFMLSLSANIWWGFLRGHEGDDTRAANTEHALTVYRFQAQLPNRKALQDAVAVRATIESEGVGRSFIPSQDRRVVLFRLGTSYADALAALHGQVTDAASVHLRDLSESLRQVQAPPILLAYLQEVASWIQARRYADAELTQLLALFEPLYITAYGREEDAQAVSLFQMAGWLENMALVAASRDMVVTSQPERLRAYHGVLTHYQAPTNALDAFGQLRLLAMKPAWTPADREQIHRHVHTIQHLLGAMSG